ncbi:MAG TPA: N-formylglutamate amidohydrolase, partial [Usitatibacter sp.]
EPLYREREPDAGEITRRVGTLWRPYHARLQNEIARVLSAHGTAILWDAHSIVSVAPRLFEGRLADFNLGTADGAACDPALAQSLLAALEKHSAFTSVLNGRFKGGHITRAHGDPARGVHAIQMEMVEASYMDEISPYTFREAKARAIRPILREQLEIATRWAMERPGRQRGAASRV